MTFKKLLAACSIALSFATSAHAQDWPQKTVSFIVPFPAGGSTDMVARAIAPKLGEKLGQTFLVDNKAGATGTIGATQVKRSAPDGYTFLVTSLGPLVIAPHLIKGMQYDALKDFDLITVAVQAPNVLVVPANSPHKTMADLIASLKANPGKMTFASSGNGSSDHLTAELFWQQTGTQGLHVPYKGGAPAITDLLGGQVDMMFATASAVGNLLEAGKLRALGVTTSQRSTSPDLAKVPTIAESGVPGYAAESWYGLFAPAGTPPAVVARLNAAARKAVTAEAFRKRADAEGLIVSPGTPEDFGRYVHGEETRWSKVVKDARITLN